MRPSGLAVLAAATATAAVTGAPPCKLPSTYNWTSTEILANPANNWKTLQAFTHVNYKGQNLVYATSSGTGNPAWGSTAFGLFSDWSQMGSAKQTTMNESAISASLFLFRPKNIWVLAYQWSTTTFSYKTSKNPADLGSWSSAQPLFTGTIDKSLTGPVDQAIIADDKNIYLFFCGDNGKVYRTSMPIGNFPGNFGDKYSVVMSEATHLLFESVQVYSVAGNQGYLMIVEAIGQRGRYVRSFTASTLDGSWTPQATTESNPFAGPANTQVTWTKNIGHGELIRKNPDQTMTIDPCHLEFLYQGIKIDGSPDFGIYAYRPGLLTLQR